MKLWRLAALITGVMFGQVASNYGQFSLSKSNFGTLSPTVSFYGKGYIERIGYALAGAGDVNGDGFDDFLIGTFHNAVMGSDAGAAYLFLGHAHLRWTLDDSVGNADARFMGQQAFDAAGYSVACNGDLNGDGFDDMIIGAPAGNDKVPWMSGRVYLVFGKKAADWGYYFRLFESANTIYEGEDGQNLTGLSVAYIGDMNGDGFDDFLIGAPFKDGKYENEGKAYLVLGRSARWLKTDYLNYADASFIYEVEGAEAGYSVAGIGDVNDDGVPDFAIGAFGSSLMFILYGRSSINWGRDFDLENADVLIYGNNRYAREGIGWRVAGGGDLNGDGISDLLVSAIQNSDGGFQTGKVYVLFGKHGGWGVNEISLMNTDASFVGEQPTDQAGWGLAMAGDVDGDGFDDFLVGTYKDDHGPIDGKAYLIKGKATDWKMNVPLSSIPDYCERSADGIGYAVASAGDFDNDGLADYIIAAPFNSDIQKWNGKVYLFASQQIPLGISGRVTYYQTVNPIPNTMIWADTLTSAGNKTDDSGNYQIFVRARQDHFTHIQKARSSDLGTAITSYDAALIARLAIDLDTPPAINTKAADVTLDGKINMYDAANTLRQAVELSPLADSRAGEWVFTPESIFYDSVIAPYVDQNYVGFVRGDVDLNWHSPNAGLVDKRCAEKPVQFQATVNGDEIMLPINYNLEIPIISFDLDIAYDQQAMKFERIETTDLTAGFQVAINSELANQLKIGAFSQHQITAQGTLFSVVFKKTDANKAVPQISINKFLINNFCLTATAVNASIDDQSIAPDRFELHQNYPNPFNSATTIAFNVPTSGSIKLVIYNLLGEELTTLFNGVALPGKYRMTWDGKTKSGNPVTAGVYIGKFFHSAGTEQIKIIYMK